MDYLNPTLNEIENQELICAARFVHWSMNDPAHRKIQVDAAVEHIMNGMIEYHKRFNLDHAPAKVCALICDIRHQGRASNDRIANALNTQGNWDKAYTNLLTIGNANYSSRISTIKNSISGLINQGIFTRSYNASDNSFNAT
jgi:hypothetical protein